MSLRTDKTHWGVISWSWKKLKIKKSILKYLEKQESDGKYIKECIRHDR